MQATWLMGTSVATDCGGKKAPRSDFLFITCKNLSPATKKALGCGNVSAADDGIHSRARTAGMHGAAPNHHLSGG